MKMVIVLAQYNLPLAIIDHLSPLFRDTFPESKIARGFSVASLCIINIALHPHFKSVLIAQTEDPFALTIDGSNDSGLQKMDPDVSCGCVCTRFLDMCLMTGTDAGTAAKIFEAMDEALKSR